jgi:hypothetical protein
MTFDITWADGSTTPFDALPAKVQEIGGVYGLRTIERFHAAKANTDARAVIAKEKGLKKTSDVTTADVKAWREANTAQYDAWVAAHLVDFKAAALAGNIEMPGVSGESKTQEELDRLLAAKLTMQDVFKQVTGGKKYPWPRAARNADEAEQLAAAEQRSHQKETFLAGLVEGGQYAKHAARFNRHLAAIKKDRVTSAKPTAAVQEFSNPLDAFGDLAAAAQ